MAGPSTTVETTGSAPEGEREESVPRHVAIIMDGNRRWARTRGIPEAQGHVAGVEAIHPIVEHAVRRGIEVLTIYAFSRENWQRSNSEVETLIRLLDATIRDETPRLVEEGVRVRLVGRLDELPPATRGSIEQAIAATAAGDRMTLNVAFNYSSRTEIVDAVHAYVEDGNVLAQLNEDALARYLYTSDLPDPDLLIRTGGDQRISNFLLWQAAYAELYFCKAYWPAFDAAEFDTALAEYASRTRRFGR